MTPAPKRRWFRFWARCWTILNYPVTSRGFDRWFEPPPYSLRLVVNQIIVGALLSVFFWTFAPLWNFALFFSLCIPMMLARYIHHRKVQRHSAHERPPATY
jgi:hypothetical protein